MFFKVKGKIKKYLSFRGFGFIETDDLDEDVFFHVSNYPRTALPNTGQDIEFTLIETPKGKEAVEINVIERTLERASEDEEKTDNTIEDGNLDELKGIGPKYQELLRAAGINSIGVLSAKNPGNLYNKLNVVNGRNEITKRPPTLENVEAWVRLAKE